MKLIERELGIELELKENQVSILIIENISRRLSIINQLYRQVLGQEGTWILVDGEKTYDIRKTCDIILEPFSLELNNRRVRAKLYEEIKETVNEDCYEAGLQIHSDICNYLETVLQKVPYPIQYDDSWDINNILKMYNVEILDENDNIYEKILDYIRMMNQICGIQIFIIINVKQFLTETQIVELYKITSYSKINIVLIEFNTSGNRLSQEDIYILDVDDCIITY